MSPLSTEDLELPTGPPASALRPTVEEILDRLRTHPRTKGIGWHEDAVMGGEATVTNAAGEIMPYGIFTAGSKGKARSEYRGITGTRGDLRQWYFGVEVYAKNAAEVGRVFDDTFDVLEGYEPVNCGEISYDMDSRSTSPVELRQNHYRDGRAMIFVCMFGTTL